MTETATQQFENTSASVLGVVKIINRESKGLPVQPGERVWLNAEEQQLTAQAPQRAEDNPFSNGALTAVDEPREIPSDRWFPATGQDAPQPEEAPVETTATEQPQETPEEPQEPVEEITGIEPHDAGKEAHVGVQASEEIVGTPEAQEQTGRRLPARSA
jgi:hypothetical protein